MQKCIDFKGEDFENNKAVYRIVHVFFILFAENFPAAYVLMDCAVEMCYIGDKIPSNFLIAQKLIDF